MPHAFDENDWDVLLEGINGQKCMPFLGAGACYGALPLGSTIAREWAEKFDYPLPDSDNLSRVAQYLAVIRDNMFPKETLIRERFINLPDPVVEPEAEPHNALAQLPLPLYMTTNYDDFMCRALKRRYRDPRREACRWNVRAKRLPSVFDSSPGQPPFDMHPAQPVVYHLHGYAALPDAPIELRHNSAASLVLTEADYFDLLVALAREPNLIPPAIQNALSGSSLLFIGYSLADTTFRALYQGLVAATSPSVRSLSFVVMPPPAADTPETQKRAMDYLEDYFYELKMVVYWSTARAFAAELLRRWETRQGR